jgi:carboxyl-terminal processing protease
MTAEQVKAKGIEDFQLHYALQTIGRVKPGQALAARPATAPATKR